MKKIETFVTSVYIICAGLCLFLITEAINEPDISGFHALTAFLSGIFVLFFLAHVAEVLWHHFTLRNITTFIGIMVILGAIVIFPEMGLEEAVVSAGIAALIGLVLKEREARYLIQ